MDGTGDGVSNSFRGRLADATARLNGAIVAHTPYSNGAIYVGQVPYYPGGAAHVVVRYESLEAGLLGRANMSPSCTDVHGTRVDLANAISIQIAVRSDWFTQADDRRALWESCPNSSYSPVYTCSKVFDFGSVIMHELGHAVGLAHPRQTDDHVHGYNPGPVMTLADCGIVLDQATMCQAQDSSGSNQYRTHRRTFHSWDTASIDGGLLNGELHEDVCKRTSSKRSGGLHIIGVRRTRDWRKSRSAFQSLRDGSHLRVGWYARPEHANWGT